MNKKKRKRKKEKRMALHTVRRLRGFHHMRIIRRDESRFAAAEQKSSLSNDTNLCMMRPLNHLDQQTKPTDNATYASLVRWCGNKKELSNGRLVHSHISASGRHRNIFLANLLVQMYGKCGSVDDALSVFNGIDQRDMFSWNFMIAAYVQNGRDTQAMKLYKQMQMEGVKPDKFTFFPILSASANLRALAEGRAIHERIVASRLEFDINLRTALLNMYGKCGSLREARAVFDKTNERDVISWNAMIAAYAQNGHGVEALNLFRQMDSVGINPSRITFLSTLDACASLPSLENGRAIHERIVASGFALDIAIRNALVNMYGKCGSLKDACMIFDEMHERDVISWNAMIAAYAQNGHGQEALELLRQMDLKGVKPDRITFLSALDACSSLASLENGRSIHERIVASGFEADVAVRNALVNMYGKCGVLREASAVFVQTHERNVISWTVMIAACVQNGHGKEALKLYRQMNLESVKPNRITFLSILNACASLASLENGREIHERIVAGGFQLDVVMRNALVNMYGKCGSLNDASAIFDEMHERNVISWNAIIAAYAQNGHGKEALRLFRQMHLEGVKPNMITFLSILSACNHAGLLNAGRQYFVSMWDYGITPSEEHYVRMSDLLGRAGCLDEAEDLIINMSTQPSAVAWTTLLGACRLHGDIGRGARVAKHVLELSPENASPYILLSNIYAAAGRWDDAAKVRKTVEERGLKKKLDCCWIDVEGAVHDFFQGDTLQGEIYAELKKLSRQME